MAEMVIDGSVDRNSTLSSGIEISNFAGTCVTTLVSLCLLLESVGSDDEGPYAAHQYHSNLRHGWPTSSD